MAKKAVWQGFVLSPQNGKPVSGAEVRVFEADSGLAVTLYGDRDGAAGPGNPFFTGADGFAQFYVDPARIRIEAYDSGQVAQFDDVLVGTLDNGAITADMISDGSITTDKIADDAVTLDKIDADLVQYVDTIADLRALTGLVDGQKFDVDGQVFSYTPSDLTDEVANDPNEQIYVAVTAGGTAVKESGVISDTVTVDVGGAGAFPTIGEAISFLTKFRPAYKKDGALATINLLSGFVASEQLNFVGIDLSWIKVTADDAEVVIDRSSLSEKIGRWYPFIRCQEGKTPQIHALFSMDASGAASERTGLYLIAAECFCEVGAGFKNSGERNADVTQDSLLRAPGGIFSGAGTVGVRPSTGSRAMLEGGDASSCQTGISVGSSATVNADSMDLTNCSASALAAAGSCIVEAYESDMSGAGSSALFARLGAVVYAEDCIIDSGSSNGIEARSGATVVADGAIITDCVNAGILAESGATVAAATVTATGCEYGILARTGAKVSADSATLTGASVRGISCVTGAYVSANFANFRKGGSDAPTDAETLSGGIISVTSSSTGGISKTPNIANEDGLIFSTGVVRKASVATVASGATSVAVNHGLDFTPTPNEVQITPRNDMGNASKFWVSGVGATQFTINVNADPGAGGAIFAWRAAKEE